LANRPGADYSRAVDEHAQNGRQHVGEGDDHHQQVGHSCPTCRHVCEDRQPFGCDIFVEKDGERVNGKSIMGLMMLAAGPGSKLTVEADGEDAAKALGELEGLLRRKFDED